MSEAIDYAADMLVSARASGTVVARELIGVALAGRADAYAVQAAVASRLGRVVAWKTGAPSPEATPIMAPIFENLVHASPARLPAAAYHRIGIEAEIACRLGRDLPARTERYDDDEVAEAIEAVMPAIEIVDSRIAELDDLDPDWKLADNQINGGLVLGPATKDWRSVEPPARPVTLSVDGEIVAAADGGNPGGDPLRLLTWLANNTGAHCGGLKSGQVVITGSLTGLHFVEPGADVVAEFTGLGRVEVSFEP